ncbi:hypothetical protein BU15DRAFT_73511 [Melanogaster broomeanus]|nr:hypothetical protein BU15DRAFT_73511 [Melanogaster broomeanus]
MLPITEFHFAFCGIATVAATLGYACARNAALTLTSTKETKADVEVGPLEERSLKRKLDDSDGGGSDAEHQSRPMKRSKTPPTEKRETDEDEWEVIVAPPAYEEVEAVVLQKTSEPVQDTSAPPRDDTPSHQRDATPIRETTLPADIIAPSHPEQQVAEEEPRTTPQASPPKLSPNEPETLVVVQWRHPPCAMLHGTGASPFGLAGQTANSTPAWRCGKGKANDVFGRASPADALAPTSADIPSSVMSESSSAPAHDENVIKTASQTQALTKPSSCMTGEEDETVVAELKGVKLFIKRGRKEFTDGIYGHIKILSLTHATSTKTTEVASQENKTQKPRTRLLFRRDPLGQVSMNVGLRSTVRCYFDTAENILRVILMEQVALDGKESKEDVVIYALKPGRSQKADFQSFAKTLCDSQELKSRADAVTSPSSSDATAS